MSVTIGLDADYVLQNFGPMWFDYAVDAGFCVPEQVFDVDTWNFYERLGFDHDHFELVCNQGVDEGVLFYNYPPLDGVVEATARMQANDWTVRVITNRYYGSGEKSAEALTQKWLDKWGIYHDSLHISADKTNPSTDFMADDLIENYDALDKTSCIPYLVTWPWNADDGTRRRVNNLNEFVDEVERILG